MIEPQLAHASGKPPYAWCYWTALGLVLLGPILNLFYLAGPSAIGLSEDECHYWEWARHLDYGYYSKGPGIATVLWLTLRVGRWLGVEASGQTGMILLRTPALLFSVASGWLTLDLATRVFRDARAGLMAIVLSAAVPMFAVGAMLITIDSPMYLCWAGSVYALWRRVEGGRPGWLYVAGLLTGLGFLCKWVLIAVPLCAAVAAWTDPTIRRRLATWHSLAAGVVFAGLQTPMLVWNAQHGWVTFLHVATQGGLRGTPAKWNWLGPAKRLGEYVGGQVGGLGGIVFAMLVVAVWVVWREVLPREIRSTDGTDDTAADPRPGRLCHISRPGVTAAGLRFLLAFAWPLWLFYAVLSLWKGTEVNWPAASYFAGMVLLGGEATWRWTETRAKVRRAWRVWIPVAVVWGVALTAFLQNTPGLYPWVAGRVEASGRGEKSLWHPRKWDLSARLRGMEERARVVEQVRAEMAQEAGAGEVLVATTRYDTSSSLAYYLPGQPFVFCVMSAVGQRYNQYDIWPGLNEKDGLRRLVHGGANVVLVGAPDERAVQEVIVPAFARVGPIERLPVMVRGVKLRELQVRRCYGFKGLREGGGGGY